LIERYDLQKAALWAAFFVAFTIVTGSGLAIAGLLREL